MKPSQPAVLRVTGKRPLFLIVGPRDIELKLERAVDAVEDVGTVGTNRDDARELQLVTRGSADLQHACKRRAQRPNEAETSVLAAAHGDATSDVASSIAATCPVRA